MIKIFFTIAVALAVDQTFAAAQPETRLLPLVVNMIYRFCGNSLQATLVENVAVNGCN